MQLSRAHRPLAIQTGYGGCLRSSLPSQSGAGREAEPGNHMASSTAPERLRIVGSSISSLPPALRTPSQPECCCSGRDDASFTAYATARPAVCFLRARSFGTASSGQRSGIWDQLQNHIRRQCDRLPGLSHSLGESDAPRETNQGRIKEGEDGCSELLAPREQKRILILMSDTGGGHRASAEAIKTTFELEYGDEYQVGGLFHHYLIRAASCVRQCCTDWRLRTRSLLSSYQLCSQRSHYQYTTLPMYGPCNMEADR